MQVPCTLLQEVSFKSSNIFDLPTENMHENAIKQVMEWMGNDKPIIWNSVGFYSVYIDLGGKLSRNMFIKPTDCMNEVVGTVPIDSCATMVGFHELVAKVPKVIKIVDADEISTDFVVRD